MSVASNYAKALTAIQVSSAGENGARNVAVAQLVSDLDVLAVAVASSRKLQMALGTPVTTFVEKKSVIHALCKQAKSSPLIERFMVLLCRRGRLRNLPEILAAVKKLQIESEGGIVGDVLSADPLTADDLSQLEKIFSKKVGKKVSLNVREDLALLAGLKVSVAGRTYDSSLQGQLERLRQNVSQSATAL